WDWGDPQPMSPAHQGSVYASIERQSTTYHNIDPAWFLQLYPRFVVSEPRLPLADYVKGFARCEVLDSKGESDFRIRLREPRATEFYEPDDIIDVVLSSKHGYLIREIV